MKMTSLDIVLSALQQIANSAKVRGDWEQYGVSDWREIPVSEEEFGALPEDDKAYWTEVALR